MERWTTSTIPEPAAPLVAGDHATVDRGAHRDVRQRSAGARRGDPGLVVGTPEEGGAVAPAGAEGVRPHGVALERRAARRSATNWSTSRSCWIVGEPNESTTAMIVPVPSLPAAYSGP